MFGELKIQVQGEGSRFLSKIAGVIVPIPSAIWKEAPQRKLKLVVAGSRASTSHRMTFARVELRTPPAAADLSATMPNGLVLSGSEVVFVKFRTFDIGSKRQP